MSEMARKIEVTIRMALLRLPSRDEGSIIETSMVKMHGGSHARVKKRWETHWF
jgi:hypothetical protein